jgi:hypothetical protein
MKKFENLQVNDTFNLKLLASDFIDNFYSSNGDCALARAVKRHFNLDEFDEVSVGGVWNNTVDIDLNDVRGIDFKMGSDFNSRIFRDIKNRINDERIKPTEIVYEIEMTVLKFMK